MPTRLRRIDLTALVNKTGTDTSQVPSVGATLKFYKQGAYVSAAGPVSIATNTVVAVYDSGRLVVGDTVQKGVDGSATATVAEVTSRTSIKLTIASGTLSLSQHDRLLVTTARPTIYREPSGVSAAASSPNPVTGADGGGNFFSVEPFVDVVVEGGTPSISAVGKYDIPAGYLDPRPWLDVRDYGNDLVAAYDALPSNGGTIHVPGGVTCSLSAALAINKGGVRIVGDGPTCSKIQASSSNPTHHLLDVRHGSFRLEHIEIDGRGTSAAAYDCVRLSGHAVTNIDAANFFMSDVYIHHARRNGLRITEIIESLFVRVLITDCWGTGYYLRNTAPSFSDSEDGNDPPSGGYTLTANTHQTFIDCRAANCKERGFFATDSYGTHLISFRSEAHEGRTYGRAANTALGIEMHYCAHSSADGAHLEGAYTNYNNPTTASNRAQNWAYFGVCDAIKVVNCSMLANGGDSVPQLKPTYGVLFETCDGVVSGGHRFVSMDSKGSVVASDCTGVTIFESFNNGEAACVDRIDARAASYVGGRGVRVARFANTTTRDAATTGGFTEDGTIIYLESTNKLQIRAGGAWVDLH